MTPLKRQQSSQAAEQLSRDKARHTVVAFAVSVAFGILELLGVVRGPGVLLSLSLELISN